MEKTDIFLMERKNYRLNVVLEVCTPYCRLCIHEFFDLSGNSGMGDTGDVLLKCIRIYNVYYDSIELTQFFYVV